MKKALAIIVLVLVVGCYDSHKEPSGNAPIDTAKSALGDLRTFCNGQSVDITTNVVVVGRVTTSDEAGNFHRSFFVEDSTGGIEVMAGAYDLHRKYPQGTKLSIALCDCRIGFTNGVMQVGLRPESFSSYEVGYFMSDVLMDKHIRRSNDRMETEPALVTLAELDENRCGRLVRIAGLKYEPEAEAMAVEPSEPQMAGYNRFTDKRGNAVYTFVRNDADFADMPLPTQPTAICGIVLHGNVPNAGAQYIVKPRNSDDYETDNSNR